jgi:hypothetical protein
MGATEKIVRFIVDTGYENIPRDAVEKAKRTALDCLGAAVAGVAEPVSRAPSQVTYRSSAVQPRHPSWALASKLRCQMLPWPMASLPMPWITMTVV